MTSRPMVRRLLPIPALLGATIVAPSSFAQSNTALDRYEPAPAGDTWLAVPSADAEGSLAPAVRLQVGYADAPLSLRAERDGEELGNVGDIVDHSVVLHALGSVAVAHRLKLELDVPTLLSQGGDSPSSVTDSFASPNGGSVGDVRLGARVALLKQHDWIPTAAVGLSVWLPSGDDAAYSGTGTTRFAPSLTVGSDYEFASYALTVGRRFQGGRSAPGSLLGSEAFVGLAGGPRFGPFLVGVEVFGSTVADEGVDAFEERTTHAELLLSARYDLKPAAFHAAGGPGLASGIGTPRYRLTAGVSIAGDLGELVLGRSDEPPAGRDTVGRRAEGSPGVARVESPPPDPWATSLADRDGDGVADVDDRCPDVAGVASTNPALDGCPPPERPSTEGPQCEEGSTDPACQATARIAADSIVIIDKIRFQTGSAELEAASEPILAEVAKILQAHPEIARLAVDGHTDDVGAKDKNVELSEQRALTVVRWLNEHGVDARRTEARGFGPKQPIADNATEEGRAKNRRVEFQILRRTDVGEAGWSDGSLD